MADLRWLPRLACHLNSHTQLCHAARPLPPRSQAECSALRAMINCNVCHQRQKDVIITKCWHMFCNQCIKRNLGGWGWAAGGVAARGVGCRQLCSWMAPSGAVQLHCSGAVQLHCTAGSVLVLWPASPDAVTHACTLPLLLWPRRVAAPQVPRLRRGLWPGRRQTLLLHMS